MICSPSVFRQMSVCLMVRSTGPTGPFGNRPRLLHRKPDLLMVTLGNIKSFYQTPQRNFNSGNADKTKKRHSAMKPTKGTPGEHAGNHFAVLIILKMYWLHLGSTENKLQSPCLSVRLAVAICSTTDMNAEPSCTTTNEWTIWSERGDATNIC